MISNSNSNCRFPSFLPTASPTKTLALTLILTLAQTMTVLTFWSEMQWSEREWSEKGVTLIVHKSLQLVSSIGGAVRAPRMYSLCT